MKRIFEKVDDYCESIGLWWEENIHDRIFRPINTFFYIVRTNIDLLIMFNKSRAYFHWDFCYMYDMMIWKIKHMKQTLEEENIIADASIVCNQMKEAIEQWEIYNDPNIVLPELEWLSEENRLIAESKDPIALMNYLNKNRTKTQEKEMKQYFTKYYEVEQEAWNKFHDLLKEHGQRWWS